MRVDIHRPVAGIPVAEHGLDLFGVFEQGRIDRHTYDEIAAEFHSWNETETKQDIAGLPQPRSGRFEDHAPAECAALDGDDQQRRIRNTALFFE
ncbi:MAG: hypothetical protein E5Y63_22380 [Mesorhizobium sp.]|uniref:hypothetical protein n=1 Tax=Mesorhizobium sp. TaxID=1871066 RepID=UPI0011F9686F|nr:hypothetical protein [Mesorhizobium sp.]TIM27880.1 MAG: hypothetical protein E5Y63_22380 [Mesorhizobium sp.]